MVISLDEYKKKKLRKQYIIALIKLYGYRYVNNKKEAK